MSGKKTPDLVPLVPDEAANIKIGIVVSDWNASVTGQLLEGAVDYFHKAGIKEENIFIKHVPGAFEIPLAAKWLFEFKNVDGVACLGCIIKGETPHFHYISESVSLKLADLALLTGRPAGFGIITAETKEQAAERAGGKKGNKGIEAADAVIKMIVVKQQLKKKNKKEVGF